MADALEDVVDAVGQAEVLHGGDARRSRASTKSVAPNLRAAGFLGGVGVDGDDAAGGGDAGGLHDRQADAADADDGDGLARPDLGPVEHGAGAGDDGAADEAGGLERDPGG